MSSHVLREPLRAVEVFARAHEEGELPSRAGRWSMLLPARSPRPGEQYAFEVRLDACSGCKACVTGCHALNGLEDDEAWRDVGRAWVDRAGVVSPQHVTTACHHCVAPACLHGCPVGAYEKDQVSGAVRHLDDQCFGCGYCTMTCPWEVPRMRMDLGIVRKCDLCHGRLAAGEAPACVQACPNGAIAIRTARIDELEESARRGEFIDLGPGPERTVPSTRFTGVAGAELSAAVDMSDAPGAAHPPLVVLLVATQVSVGLLTLAVATPALSHAIPARAAALASLLVGLAASVLHLGRPHLAWRAWIGWRTSWLSREALAFGAYLALLAGALLVRWLPGADFEVGVGLLDLAAVAAGWLGVGTSVLVYAATGRPSWGLGRTLARFASTTLAGGAALTLALATFAAARGGAPEHAREAAIVALLAFVIDSIVVAATLWFGSAKSAPWLAASRRLRRRRLRPAPAVSRTLGAAAGCAAAGILVFDVSSSPGTFLALGTAAAALALAAQIIERHLFFTAATHPRLPGRQAG